MAEINVGDIVARRSYGKDVFFKVNELLVDENGRKIAILKGIDIRLTATSEVDDLEKVSDEEIAAYWHRVIVRLNRQMERLVRLRSEKRQRSLIRSVNSNQIESLDLPGTVLHLDGDEEYLGLCLAAYRQMKITAWGYHVAEKEQPQRVKELLALHRPDVLVLTGHDGLIKDAPDSQNIEYYYNSRYFVAAVKAAREYEKNLDDLVIFAGACQSHYEALIAAGANFASSPQRVLINTYDPVFIVERVAYTPVHEMVVLAEVIAGTITGFAGVGGVETHGKYRLCIPKPSFNLQR